MNKSDLPCQRIARDVPPARGWFPKESRAGLEHRRGFLMTMPRLKLPVNALAVLVRGWPRIEAFSAIVIRAGAAKQKPLLVLAVDVSEVIARLTVIEWNAQHHSPAPAKSPSVAQNSAE